MKSSPDSGLPDGCDVSWVLGDHPEFQKLGTRMAVTRSLIDELTAGGADVNAALRALAWAIKASLDASPGQIRPIESTVRVRETALLGSVRCDAQVWIGRSYSDTLVLVGMSTGDIERLVSHCTQMYGALPKLAGEDDCENRPDPV